MNETDMENPVSEIPGKTDNLGHKTDSADVTVSAITTVTSDNYYQFEQEVATNIIGGFSALAFDLGVVIGLLLFAQLVRRWFV